ncbi:MAG: hypothetical protein Q7U57_09655 [Methylovulum sp.]|nr:hypothetical protein [Methylovulum sp.]
MIKENNPLSPLLGNERDVPIITPPLPKNLVFLSGERMPVKDDINDRRFVVMEDDDPLGR